MFIPDHKWHKITDFTYRMAVAGGWLYRYTYRGTGEGWAVSMVFVPDNDHRS